MNYEEMNINQLRSECKKADISFQHKKKSELIDMLKNHTIPEYKLQDTGIETFQTTDLSEGEKIAARQKRFGKLPKEYSLSKEIMSRKDQIAIENTAKEAKEIIIKKDKMSTELISPGYQIEQEISAEELKKIEKRKLRFRSE